MESLKKEIKKRIEQLHLSDENLMKSRNFRVILVAGICYECYQLQSKTFKKEKLKKNVKKAEIENANNIQEGLL